MLDPSKRPSAEQAQWAIGTVLRDVYLRFAWLTAVIAAGLLAPALAMVAVRWLA
jgi:hypothetical protein